MNRRVRLTKRGPAGAKGDRGDKGFTGPQGPQGLHSADGLATGELIANQLSVPGPARTQLDAVVNQLVGYNVTTYGAVGDGESDDTDAFTDLAAEVNADTSEHAVDVFFPAGQYLYTDGLTFTRPVRLWGLKSATLNFEGTGNAVKLGPDGLTITTYSDEPYTVQGLRFTGGLDMAQGLYFNNFVTMVRLLDVEMHNFGNAEAHAIYFAGDNWDALVQGCTFYADGPQRRNWMRVAPQTVDSTRVRVLGCLGTNQAEDGFRGEGLWFDGAVNEVAHCKIEGFAPNIRLGPLAHHMSIVDTYFETTDDGGCIQYGGVADEPLAANWIQHLKVRDCYANMHNADDIATESYFLEPTNPDTALQYAYIDGVWAASTDRELVLLNNVGSQTGNEARNLRGVTGVYAPGSNILPWKEDGKNSVSTTGFLMTAAGAPVPVITFEPPSVDPMIMKVSAYITVANAPTYVILQVWYQDGTSRTEIMLDAILDVGAHSVGSILLRTEGLDDTIVAVQVGTANNVTVAAHMERVD